MTTGRAESGEEGEREMRGYSNVELVTSHITCCPLNTATDGDFCKGHCIRKIFAD